MAEHRIDVKAVKVKMLCENCTMGYVNKVHETGHIQSVYNLLYKHRCENCGYERDFEIVYPYIEYVEI